MHVQAKRVLPEPAEAGIGGGPAVVVFAEPGDGAVVDDLAFGIAPAAVDDLVHGDLVDVAGDDAVDEAGGVAAGDAVFEERGDVNQRGGVANGVVFVFVVGFIDADGVIAGPFAIVEALAEREGAFVKSGSDGQRSLLESSSSGIIRARHDAGQASEEGGTQAGEWRVTKNVGRDEEGTVKWRGLPDPEAVKIP